MKTNDWRRQSVIAVHWILVFVAAYLSWHRLFWLYIEPRDMQQRFLGTTLQLSQLRAHLSTYAYDGSGLDTWTYEVDRELAEQLQKRCQIPSVIQFYDPRSNFENNAPLRACIFAVQEAPNRLNRRENARLSGRLVVLFRATD